VSIIYLSTVEKRVTIIIRANSTKNIINDCAKNNDAFMLSFIIFTTDGSLNASVKYYSLNHELNITRSPE
jgi:hypothetical protein